VNRLHLYSHKVPRSRALITVVLRGTTCPTLYAGSPWIKFAGVRRWVGGKASKSACLWCGPFVLCRPRRIRRCPGAESASEAKGVRQSNNAFERPLAASARLGAPRPAAQRER